MSPVAERLERLEEWRVASERRAGETLRLMGTMARHLERVATAVETMAARHVEERAARRERRRLRAAAYAGASLFLVAVGALAGKVG